MTAFYCFGREKVTYNIVDDKCYQMRLLGIPYELFDSKVRRGLEWSNYNAVRTTVVAFVRNRVSRYPHREGLFLGSEYMNNHYINERGYSKGVLL